MPLAWAAAEPCTITVTCSGDVTFEEVRALQVELAAHAPLRDSARMLVDANAVCGAPTASELRIIALEMKPLLDAGLGPIAIVCGSTFIYGVARMFAMLAVSVNANVGAFRDMAEARDWLSTQATAA